MTMALKDLLVHVVNEADSGAAIDAALVLAEQHDAHLVGLGISAPIDIPAYAEAHLPEAMLEILQDREVQRLANAKQLFESKARHAGRSERAEWRFDEGVPYQTLGLHARYADLSVVPQNKSERQDYRFAELAEDLLVSSGRPVLVIPASGAKKSIGRTVIVAWNGSREAARALADAMPLLEKARTVEVFVAGKEDIGDLPGADIAAHLARHKIDVKVNQSAAAGISVGDALLNRASDIGADLIVMGGYGRSRFREFVLGGVTRHILEHLTVPALMSH
jgi:nucleotide-binding universal stress UspA family protein